MGNKRHSKKNTGNFQRGLIVRWEDIVRKHVGKWTEQIFIHAGASVLMSYVPSLLKSFSYYFYSSVNITSDNEASEWIIYWLKEQEKESPKSSHVTLVAFKHDFSGIFRSNQPTAKEKHQADIGCIPSPGSYNYPYKNKTIQVSISKNFVPNASKSNRSNSSGSSHLDNKYESSSIVLSTFGYWNQGYLMDFVEDLKNQYLDKNFGKTLVYIGNSLSEVWEAKISKPKRRPDTVYLRKGIFEELVMDAKNFLESSEWYYEKGIPFRRGYLLYGCPGSGKTSTIMAIAGLLDFNVCVLNLSDSNLRDDNLYSLMINAPPNSIILFEDVDYLLGLSSYNNNNNNNNSEIMTDEILRQDKKSQISSNLTMAGFLNSIDGVVAQEGRLIFMTTNNKPSLPPVLIRPGRIDKNVHIGYCDVSQAMMMFERFYPQATTEQVERFREKVTKGISENSTLSMAALQGYLLNYKDKNQIQEAINHIDEDLLQSNLKL